MKKSLHFASVMLLAGVSSTALSATIIQDIDFSAWSSFTFVTDDPLTTDPQPNVPNGSAARVATGGNTDAFLQVTHEISYGDTAWTGGIKTDAYYNPAVDGAIDFLSFSADLLNSAGSNSAWQLVVEQGGQRYFSFPFGAFSGTSWSGVSLSGLSATNFDTNPWANRAGVLPDGSQPDFGSTGTQLQFGFVFGDRLTGNGVLPNTLGLDNFKVEIASSPVPVPAAIWLFGSGLAGLIGFVRARNRT